MLNSKENNILNISTKKLTLLKTLQANTKIIKLFFVSQS